MRKYDGPRLTGGKIHYPGNAGHLNQATSPSTPKLVNGAVSDPKGDFAGSIKPGAKLPAKAAAPTANMLAQNVGKGPARARTPRDQQPKHSVMKAPEGDQRGSDTLMVRPDRDSAVNRKKAQIMREQAEEARATQARWMAAQQRAEDKQRGHLAVSGPPPAPPSGQGQPAGNAGAGQGLGNARRGFGKQAKSAQALR